MDTCDVTIKELSVEEGKALLDEQSRRRLGISGEEFVREWQAGTFDEQAETSNVIALSLLLPFASNP